MTDEERIAEFKERWHEADEMGIEGRRVEYALKPLLDALREANEGLANWEHDS